MRWLVTPDDSLAHVSLVWIVDEAMKCGLRFQGPAVRLLRDRVDENGTNFRDNSRKGLAGYYRYNAKLWDRPTSER